MSRFGDDTLGLNREIQASLQTAASGRADIEGQMASLDEIIDGSNIVDAMRSDADYLSVQSQGAGLLGAPGRYISETAVGAYEQTVSAVKGTVTGTIPALLDETVKDLTKKIARGRGLPDEITDSIVELAAEKQGFKTLADYGRKRIEGRKGKEPSYFRDSDIWIKPEDLAGAVPSVVAGLSMIATSGAAAPIAVPVMAAGISVPAMQAADSLYGDYAEALSENPDLEYDPKVAAALGAVVALETIGTKTVGVDLPMMMAKKAFKQSVKEGAKASTRKTLAKRVLSELAAAGVDGIEEVGEEGLEALITILYQPEYDDLRESILSGDFDKSDFGKVWEVLSSVDFGKTFVIGSGSYGFTRPAAALRQRYDTRDIRAAERSRRAEEIALDVRRGDVADIPIGREPAGDIPAEDITPGEAEPAPVEPVTFADFDNDKFADRLVAESPDVVDGILKTENGRNRKSGRAKAIWGSSPRVSPATKSSVSVCSTASRLRGNGPKQPPPRCLRRISLSARRPSPTCVERKIFSSKRCWRSRVLTLTSPTGTIGRKRQQGLPRFRMNCKRPKTPQSRLTPSSRRLRFRLTLAPWRPKREPRWVPCPAAWQRSHRLGVATTPSDTRAESRLETKPSRTASTTPPVSGFPTPAFSLRTARSLVWHPRSSRVSGPETLPMLRTVWSSMLGWRTGMLSALPVTTFSSIETATLCESIRAVP